MWKKVGKEEEAEKSGAREGVRERREKRKNGLGQNTGAHSKEKKEAERVSFLLFLSMFFHCCA